MKSLITLIVLFVTPFSGLSIPLCAFEVTVNHTNLECDRSIPFSYNERGNISFANGDYIAALYDYQAAVRYVETNQIDDPSNLLRGICGSMFCYEFLNNDDASREEFHRLTQYVHFLGDEVDRIDWFRNSPVYNAYREKRHLRNSIITVDLPEMTKEEHCQLQCDGYAVAAGYACSRVPNPAVQFVCVGCIFGLQQLCTRCCMGKGFWENCVKGLRRLFHDPEHPENPAPHPNE
jgi:hypothetical protein